uniref:Uncharacterized protein n=1 Tax=Syphacia muris TaxID=451379 RepID=A0A0N5AL38_9BILA
MIFDHDILLPITAPATMLLPNPELEINDDEMLLSAHSEDEMRKRNSDSESSQTTKMSRENENVNETKVEEGR